MSVPRPTRRRRRPAWWAGCRRRDSIDDLDLLRHGGMPRLFTGVRAPSTLGTFLRSFTHGHVQQLDAVGGDLLAGLTARVPGLIAAPRRRGVRVYRRRRHHPRGPRLRQAGCGLRLHRGAGAEYPTRHHLHPAGLAGDRPGPSPQGQRGLGQGRRQVAGSGHHHRPGHGREESDPVSGRLGLYGWASSVPRSGRGPGSR